MIDVLGIVLYNINIHVKYLLIFDIIIGTIVRIIIYLIEFDFPYCTRPTKNWLKEISLDVIKWRELKIDYKPFISTYEVYAVRCYKKCIAYIILYLQYKL